MKHWIDELIQRLYQNSDEDLLREFKVVEAEIGDHCEPDPEGFERLYQRFRKMNGDRKKIGQ
ncbi:MAG: hypothetical protein KH230_20405 [Enterocloster asparagiformis]|nr:hypothetical protein [Enterocloster asparagiformis]